MDSKVSKKAKYLKLSNEVKLDLPKLINIVSHDVNIIINKTVMSVLL